MITITICVGSSCHMKGSYDIANGIQELIKQYNLEEKVIIKASFCLGNCTKAVAVTVNDGQVISVARENLDSFFINYVLNKI